MKTAAEIIEAIGRDRIKQRLGVKDRVVRHYIATGVLPALWYADICDLIGGEVPRECFSRRSNEHRSQAG